MKKDWKQKRKKELRSKYRCAACYACLIIIGPTIAFAASKTEHKTNAAVIEETSYEPIIRWKQAQVEEKIVDTEKCSYEATPDDIELEQYYDSLEEMAICVEAEAGNQGIEGKRLVVDVILNRVDDEGWPDTIKGVIEQKYQFSSFWDGGMDKIKEPSEETFEACRIELEQRSYPQLFYFTAGGYGRYGTPWKKVGDHYFCTK